MDIQKIIDDLLKNNPKLSKYVKDVVYVPQGSNWLDITGATFALKLTNRTGDEVVVAFTAVEPYGFIADALLKKL